MSRPYNKRYRKNYNKSKDERPAKKKKDDDDDNHPTFNAENEYDSDDESLNVYAFNNNNQPKPRYFGCKLYFDSEDIDDDELIIRINAAIKFMEKNPDIYAPYLSAKQTGPAFNVNVDRFNNDEEFIDEWSSFNIDLVESPSQTLNCLGLALYHVLADSLQLPDLPMLRVKVFNQKPVVPSSDLKASSRGKLVATRGCVIRVGRPSYMCGWMLFSCKSCKAFQVVKQKDWLHTLPKKCKECSKCKFTTRLASRHTKTTLFQVIKLQENLDNMQDDSGKMPRILEVELFDDLVRTCVPGDDVTVVGIIKARGIDDGIPKAKGKGKDLAMTNAFYIEAVSIVNNKNKSQTKSASGIELEDKDYKLIQNIESDPDNFPLLVRSLCPAIYGHEMIKAGLLLSLFGGTANESSRDDIHVLMVGDPGLGKSQMLQACARIASKGVYVCGNSSTSSGLTVTLSKEGGTNDFALEPGALVLADRGCCLIDEFDKMPTQHQALLEAMEQQTVSVAKSGVLCSLPARTSILAAANPIGGRYNANKSVIDNLNLSQPLLSRCDLIFLLLDQPDREQDSLLVEHVMNARKGFQRAGNQLETQKTNLPSTSALVEHHSPIDDGLSLRERLSAANRRKDIIPQVLLRKYVAYARQYVKPKLTREAAKVLQRFYLKLREQTHIFGSLPVFHRQLEALIRLTEARAKLSLRLQTTEEDAVEVVEIYKYALSCVPKINLHSTLKNDGGKITANKVKAFIKILKDEVKSGVNRFTKTDLNELAIDNGILVDDFNSLIRKLNDQGILLKLGNDIYKFGGD
ncbi:DNA helicase MCM8-like isoform X2 [Cotesia glomerata]|uniref:DNA helicase MCM8-like isoform X2 n=1 Tax=Cotesia glomerata TaxID=32391 RepID=UPI001D0092FB|nr:DNA helicase MCM8-like isoform X2 [Cotesia glomerata]